MSPLISIPKWAAANPQTARLLIIILSLLVLFFFLNLDFTYPKSIFGGRFLFGRRQFCLLLMLAIVTKKVRLVSKEPLFISA
jgi:hypothetical protein